MVSDPQTDLVILNYIANHIIQSGAVNQDFIRNHTKFAKGATNIGYGLRPTDPRELKAENAAVAASWTDISFEDYAEFLKPYTLEHAAHESGVPAERLKALAELYADPKNQGDVVLDHGLQPAHPRCLGEQHDLQHSPAHWKDQRAGQQPLLPYRPTVGMRHRPRGWNLLASSVGRHGGDQPQAPRRDREDLEAARRDHPGKARLHALQQSCELIDGGLKVYRTQGTNNMQAGPKLMQEVLPGWRNPGPSSSFPTSTPLRPPRPPT
jgi:nitrate reductase NapA